jgi:hypothetical protein
MPREIVINRCYGGFGLSSMALEIYRAVPRVDLEDTGVFNHASDIPRDDPILIQTIKTLGLKESAGNFAKLQIIEIPDDVPADGWIIQDYDGTEWVAEKHRTWSGPHHTQEDDDLDEPVKPVADVESTPIADQAEILTTPLTDPHALLVSLVGDPNEKK